MRIFILALFLLGSFWYCLHAKPSRMAIIDIDASGIIVDNFSFINPSAKFDMKWVE